LLLQAWFQEHLVSKTISKSHERLVIRETITERGILADLKPTEDTEEKEDCDDIPVVQPAVTSRTTGNHLAA